ncbi:MAG TPA: cupredoxin domain-containing protein [Candidatus Binataceae bacterium]
MQTKTAITKPGAILGAFILAIAADVGLPAGSAADNPRVISIAAKKYDFSPNQITLRKGEPVTIELTSQDRTHGFLVKALGIDTDIKPGQTTSVTVTPKAAGTYTVICDHYCGIGHGGMNMTVTVE